MNGKYLILIMVAAICLAHPASASYNAEFFHGKTAYVKFDRKTFTWRIGNKVIERVIRFDPAQGSLQTLEMVPTKGHEIFVPYGDEGTVHLSGATLSDLSLNSGWRMTDKAPAGNWTGISYNDSSWSAINLPFKTNEQYKTWWLRRQLPPQTTTKNAEWNIVFDHAIDDEADIYVDGHLLRKVTDADQAWSKEIDVTLPPHALVVAIKLVGYAAPNGIYGDVRLVDQEKAPVLRLDRDWHYMWDAIGLGQGGRLLTIHLQGTGPYGGYEMEVNYEVYPGDRPYVAKWLSVMSHHHRQLLISKVTEERWQLMPSIPASAARYRHFVGASSALVDEAGHKGLVLSVLSNLGNTEYNQKARLLTCFYEPNEALVPNKMMTMPRSVTGLYTGTTATGAFLYQLYVGEYFVHSNPTYVPIIYNTWYGYYRNINAATCEKIIPLAAQIGAKLFVIDDGWQTNAAGKGVYGDWVVDRAPDKFPDGLKPISELCRRNGMRFGIWNAPVMTDPDSRNATEHPDWLVKTANGTYPDTWPGKPGFCFTRWWAHWFTQHFGDMASNDDISFYKCDSALYMGGCVQPDHGHPVGHSVADQVRYWHKFCRDMRKIDPDFIIDRAGYVAGPEACNMEDESWFGDWYIGYNPKRMSERLWWYKNADIYRETLHNLTWVRPSYCIGWETPCHIPTNTPDINALEYHFTSIGAYICNVEWHGKIDRMMPLEKSICKKWSAWNWRNRPWLACTQPILQEPWNPLDPHATPHIDGVMHLRNALHGKYGFICLWNPGQSSNRATISFNPANYFINMDPSTLEIHSIRNGERIPFNVSKDGTITISNFEMPALSWNIFRLTVGPAGG